MRNIWKKLGIGLTAGVLIASAAFSFTACGPSDNRGYVDEETGTVYLTFAGRSNDAEEANFRTFINQFMDEHPNYVIDVQWYANETAYMLALKGMGSDLPDLFFLGSDQFVSFAEAGLLADYKEYVDMDELKTQIYEYAAEAYCYNTETDTFGWDPDDPNCGFYGYPKDQGPYALMYNKTLFEQLASTYNEGKPASQQISLPSANKPYTYQEFIDVCLALKGVYQSKYGTTFYPCAGYDLDTAIYSNNADYFDEGAFNQTITTDNFVTAIEFYQDLYTEGVIAPYGGTFASGESAFINGNALFFYVGPWKMKDYWQSITFEWDMTPACVGPAEGAVSTAYMGSMGYCISARSQVKEQAAFLAQWLATNENAQRSQYMRGQSIPNLVSMAEEFNTDSKGLLANRESPDHRSVWIDIVDGYGQTKVDENGEEYVDCVTGKWRAERFTYSSAWRKDISNWLAGQGTNGLNVWKGEISARESLEQFAPLLQQLLDDMKAM